MKSDNDMKRKLVINSAKDAEIISVRLSPDKTPIAYENKVRCLMLSGLSREEAEKVALEPMDLELYYEIGAGLMAVDPAAVEPACMGRQSGKTRRSPCSLAWLSNKITYKCVRKYEY